MKNRFISIIGAAILFLAVLGILASVMVDVDFAEKHLVKGEIREQSKVGVAMFQSQLRNLSILFWVAGLLIVVLQENIDNLIRKRKGLFINLALLVATLLILIVLGEIVLRLFFADKIYSEYGLGPGYTKLTSNVKLNSLGYRDVEHSFESDSKRILIIGDSMTYGAGIDNFEDVYGRVLQRRLDKNYGKGAYEVIILSNPGYSTIDEFRVLRDLGIKYEPEILVLGYQVNDAEGPESRIGFEKLYFYHYFYPNAIGGWLYKHSFAYYAFESRLKNLFRAYGFEDITYVDYIKHLYDNSTEFQQVHSRLLENLIRLAQQNEMKVFVFDIPSTIDPEDYPFSQAVEYVGNIAEENGADFFTLLPVLAEHDIKELKVSFLDGHLNEKGQAIAGEALYERLEEGGYLK